MAKPKLIIFSQLPQCPCYDKIFNTKFKTFVADTENEFLNKIKNLTFDAAIVCFCSTRDKDARNLLRLDVLSGPMPVLTCSKTLNLDFICWSARQYVDRFLLCDMEVEKIHDIIFEAIRGGGLKEFLESCCPGSIASSPYVRKLIDEIVHAFPHRLEIQEIAERLGIKRSWLYKLCRQAFDRPVTSLLRCVWVHQALRMMQHTNLDNTDIALQLSYSEESNMARDFRKELGYNPKEARKRLTRQTPEELLH